MISRVRKNDDSSRWPFWLLLAAWICANTPQVALFVLVSWLAEARTFSHQDRLTRDVALLLKGESSSGLLAAARKMPSEPRETPPATQLVLKKIDLSLERTCDLLPPALRAVQPHVPEFASHGTLRAAPPTEPPRLTETA